MTASDLKNNIYYPALIVSLVTFSVYLPAVGNDFINWDDTDYVLNNPYIRSLDLRMLSWAFFDFHATNWHPLTWISHAIDYAVWGLNPIGHHLTSSILHALNTLLTTIVSYELASIAYNSGKGRTGDDNLTQRKKMMIGVTTGLLFGLHPLHVESVAWISERKDLLCGMFFLLSIRAYLRFSHPVPSGRMPYLLSLLFFMAALMSKPMAVSLPFVLLIIDWYPGGRLGSVRAVGQALIEKLPFFALSAVSSVITILAQMRTIAPLADASLLVRVQVAAAAIVAYIRKMVLPLDLLPFYPWPKEVPIMSVAYSLPVGFIALITVICIARIKREPFLAACWAYYIVTLIPVLGIVKVGDQAMADRYTYLPGIGLFLLAGIAAAALYDRAVNKRSIPVFISLVFAAGILSLMSYKTVRQISIWENSQRFWTYLIDRSGSGVYFAHYNLGNHYKAEGSFDLAIDQYRKALMIRPDHFESYNNMGNAYQEKGQFDLAIDQYRKALIIRPENAQLHLNMGNAFHASGRFDQAIEQYQKALTIWPEYAEAYGNMLLAHEAKDRLNRQQR